MNTPGTRIGIFDSGFGGLDIARAIVAALPEYEYRYLGDTARAPYGDRSQDAIYDYTRQAIDFLFSEGCALVVLACNTASSEALRRIQEEYLPRVAPEKRVLGVLIPAAEAAAGAGSRVGIIATTGTVASGAFPRELAKLDAALEAFQQACPLLVPLVEAGEHESAAASAALASYLEPLLAQDIDTLILGCTHYGILEAQIRAKVGSRVRIISEARVVPEKLAAYLARHLELAARLNRSGTIRFYSTGDLERFARLGSIFFGRPIEVERAVLGC
jgi:glutamate racemase